MSTRLRPETPLNFVFDNAFSDNEGDEVDKEELVSESFEINPKANTIENIETTEKYNGDHEVVSKYNESSTPEYGTNPEIKTENNAVTTENCGTNPETNVKDEEIIIESCNKTHETAETLPQTTIHRSSKKDESTEQNETKRKTSNDLGGTQSFAVQDKTNQNTEHKIGQRKAQHNESQRTIEHNGNKKNLIYNDTKKVTEQTGTQVDSKDNEVNGNAELALAKQKTESRGVKVSVPLVSEPRGELVHQKEGQVTTELINTDEIVLVNETTHTEDTTVPSNTDQSKRPTVTSNSSPVGAEAAFDSQRQGVTPKDYEQWLGKGWGLNTEEFVFPERDPDVQANNNYLPKPVMDIEARLRGCEHQCRHATVSTFRYRRSTDEDEYDSPGDRFKRKTAQVLSPLMQIAKTAQKRGFDLSFLLECSDAIFGQMFMSCKQCRCQCGGHRAEGHGYNQGHGDNQGHTSSHDQGHKGGSLGGKAGENVYGGHVTMTRKEICPTCGTKTMSFESYCKMFSKLRRTVQEKDFVVHDAFPDGNCQLSVVVDQLRVRGNFRFTVQTLREQAVAYLRQNPMTYDNTHYEQFLVDETWDVYLSRMAHDGSWGDHIMLNAISNVINMDIVVYGGTLGETETRITPAVRDTSPRNRRETVTQQEPSVIHVGHLEESHYISLRPRNWRTDLLKDLTQIQTGGNKSLKRNLQYNMYHIDNIVRIVLKLEYITHPIDTGFKLPLCDQSDYKFTRESVGSIANHMHPVVVNFEQNVPGLDILFPNESSTCVPELPKTVGRFISPTDTRVKDALVNAGEKDLVIEQIVPDNITIFRLYPKNPSLWDGQTAFSRDNKACLVTNDAFCFPYDKNKAEYSFFEMLTFQCEWPVCAEEWLTRRRPHVLVDPDLTRDVRLQGCHIIPVASARHDAFREVLDFTIPQRPEGGNNLWCYSFAVAEKYICLDALSGCHRRVFLLFRYMIHTFLHQSPIPLSIQKSIFLYTCENVQEEEWRIQPGRCVMIMFSKLLEGLKRRRIPHYFISSVNLLSDLSDEDIECRLQTVSQVHRHFLLHLFWTLDSSGLLSGELGPFVDGVFADFVSYSYFKTPLLSFHISVVPALKDMVREMFSHKQFRLSLLILDELQEQKRIQQGSSSSYSELIESTMEEGHMDTKYAMALYIDMCKHTAVAEELGRGVRTVKLSSVLGPDLPDILRTKRVATELSIAGGQVQFMLYIIAVLKSCRLPRAQIVSCLRYYLESYSQIAGENMVIQVCESGCCRIRHMDELCRLYIELIALYICMKQPEEYRALMDNFGRLCNKFKHDGSMKWLVWAWRHLGEEARACELETQSKATPRDTLESLLDRVVVSVM